METDKCSGRRASQVAQWSRVHLPIQETWVRSLDWEDSLEEEKATHSSMLTWEISWTKELGKLQSMGSQSQIRHSNHTTTFRKKAQEGRIPFYLPHLPQRDIPCQSHTESGSLLWAPGFRTDLDNFWPVNTQTRSYCSQYLCWSRTDSI